MKVGVKTWDNESFLEHFENKSDFFEVQAIQKNDYEFLKKFKKPIVIHAEHGGFGVNFPDPSLHAKNLKSVNFARALADSVKAKKIIVHPGRVMDKNCSLETSKKFVRAIKDDRIIIENHSQPKKGIGSNPDSMKEFLKFTGKKLCFDINHAIASANSSREDYIKYIKEYVKLKPVHYHFGGQKLINFFKFYRHDLTHLSLIDSNIDLKEIIRVIPKDAEITLETTTSVSKVEDDLCIMKKLGWRGFDGKGYFKKEV